METPVLTSKQLRKSLSAKKGTIKGLKNVLANPFENNRPILKNDCAELENLLKSLLPAMKQPEPQKIPWSKLRMMSKEERTLAKKNTSITNSSLSNKNVIDSVVFGTNSVIRLLEKDNVSSILLDTTIANLPVVVPDIIRMTKSKNVPIFLVPFLKTVTLETVGFASGAICLKKNVAKSLEHYFYPLHKKISELMQKETESKISVDLFKDQSLMNDTKEDEINFKNIQEDSKEVEKPFVLSTDVYLYRKSKTERVFKCSNEIEENEPLMETSDFIPLGDIDFDVTNQQTPLVISDKRNFKIIKNKNNNGKELQSKNNKVSSVLSNDNKECKNGKEHYKPLKVKRLQGNPLRTKRTKPKGKK